MDRAAEICQQMLAFSGKGRREVECIRLQPMIVDMVNLLNGDIEDRAEVYEVVPRSPAASAGIEAGDVIVMPAGVSHWRLVL